MSIGKRLLLFSNQDPKATELMDQTANWGCVVTRCESQEELRGKVEGGNYDMLMVDGVGTVRRMIGEYDPDGELLTLPLAEIEKRHIMRVLSSTSGNKTRAAKILGIDTKTLYNKLKAYAATSEAYRRRREAHKGVVSA